MWKYGNKYFFSGHITSDDRYRMCILDLRYLSLCEIPAGKIMICIASVLRSDRKTGQAMPVLFFVSTGEDKLPENGPHSVQES